MATTNLKNYTVQEKLNKMDVDLISITPTVSAGTDAAGDLLFDSIEIENAVAVNGGTSILQSIAVFSNDDNLPSIDLLFYQVTQDFGTAGTAITGTMTAAEANAAVLLGHVAVTDWCILANADAHLATKTNVGLILKAAAASTSIYMAGIVRSACASAWGATSDVDIRLGIMKD